MMRRRFIPAARRVESQGANPTWYKDAIIYELRVRSYYDGNGDGVGDFLGAAAKLDYLQDLGVTAIWMLPFYPSPLRDDGYDIADYTDVHPDCGTLAEFEYFLAEAHRRQLRVITELVLNHTSDRHPWFRRAREAAPGTPERDFYVWSNTPERYRDARIIFKDFELSNWTWDAKAKAYFWHRFYSHQPDLNFENPVVHDALLKVVDFWLEKGVDGLRLDAVPYLYEAEGTNCENLAPTHAFLRRLRAHIDGKYADRMLLAEANQWPEDAAAYFGTGDECHMNFHFPIMPRMFMAIHMEDRFPLLDILAQTPAIPANCQWALFLRNHDELTLEMVTDEERDYMYRAYANDNEMRINLGIRRRLAPLVGNDRRKIELLTGLLLSLPGTPVLYYGDEIGMGDNIFLGDRNGVRTPMQWSADRNAGFSRANPQRLILPITIDPEYHYEAINVEAQQNNPNSLLWWTKRVVALRKRFQAFGRGTIEFLTPSNHRVLAFVRQYQDETILVVANLSRFVQYVELDLSKWKGAHPVEVMGHTRFPAIGELPYLMTLGSHAFYWFSVDIPQAGEEAESAANYRPPLFEVASLESLLRGGDRPALEDALAPFLYTRRWFTGRVQSLTAATVDQVVALGEINLLLVRVEYADVEPERFVVPLALVSDGRSVAPQAVLGMVRAGGSGAEMPLIDAVEDPASARALLDCFVRNDRANLPGGGVLEAVTFTTVTRAEGEPSNVGAQHSSAEVRYGDSYFLKMYRRVEDGLSPELEMNRHLNARAPGLTPPIVGTLQLRRGRAEPATLAVLQAYVANEGTAWTHAREELRRYIERVLTRYREAPALALPTGDWLARSRAEMPPEVREVIGTYTDSVALLGRRTADLHLALASDGDPAFAPEPYATLDRRSKYQSMRNIAGKTLRALRANLDRLPSSIQAVAAALARNPDQALRALEPLLSQQFTGLRMRIHGDYHLDQVLSTGKDFIIIDFDGQAGDTLGERRRKHSCLRDVAGMIRSFHFAARAALLDTTILREEDRAAAEPWLEAWHRWLSATFLGAYRQGVGGASILPADDELSLMLNTQLLAAALRELNDELIACRATVAIPVLAVAELLERPLGA